MAESDFLFHYRDVVKIGAERENGKKEKERKKERKKERDRQKERERERDETTFRSSGIFCKKIPIPRTSILTIVLEPYKLRQ